MKKELFEILSIDQSKISSINQFLSVFTKYANAKVSILWELNDPMNCLYVVADSFEGYDYPIKSISAKSSIIEQVIKENKEKYIAEINFSEKQLDEVSCLKNQLGIKSFFVIPVEFENNNIGAISIYSDRTNDFDESTRKELLALASIFPNWYYSVKDRVTYLLLNKVDERLKEIENTSKIYNLQEDGLISNFQKLCVYIAEAFQCFEVSVILKNQFKSKEDYKCVATTWENRGSLEIYNAGDNKGLTSWILEHKSPVHIPDLTQFENEEQRKNIQTIYPGISWNAIRTFKRSLADRLGISDESSDSFPSIAFIGVPIIIGEKVFGVLRCCAALKSPYYLGYRELDILKLISSRIGEVWNTWIQASLIKDDIETWKKIIDTTNKLDGFVLNEIISSSPDLKVIFNKVLAEIPELVADAAILDVRLLNEFTGELYFFTTFGKAWHDGPEIEQEIRFNKKFPISGPRATSAGARVFKNSESQVLDPIDKKKHHYDETFDEATRMILAPLIIRGTVLGVLDVRSVSDRPFQSSAKYVVELMAGQLAVYHELVKSVLELRNLQRDQNKTFQDFVHQLRSPIYQASIRARLAIKEEMQNNSASNSFELRHINATSGLCNKAKRVATNLRLFSDLSGKVLVNLRKTSVKVNNLSKVLIEAAADHSVTISPSKRIEIIVQKISFGLLDSANIFFDMNMLEQAINILLDNAIKYSYNDSVIEIRGGLLNNMFYIAVLNKGLPIIGKEVTLCRIRGWRSEPAKLVTGEGGGIGLWVLDNIMKAHGGGLQIFETNTEGITELRIYLNGKV